MQYTYPNLIDFELRKEDSQGLFFEIYSQDKSLIPTLDANGSVCGSIEFKASNGYEIECYDYLDILGNRVYLLGYATDHKQSGTYQFAGQKQRDITHDSLLKAMDEFAASRGSWRQGSSIEPEQLTLWD